MRFELPKLTRCCFCLPLRRGVIVFGYLNFVFSALMIGLYSYVIHNNKEQTSLIYHGVIFDGVARELCLIIYILELLFNWLLIYAAHKRIYKIMNWFFHYGVVSILATLTLQGIQLAGVSSSRRGLGLLDIEMLSVTFAGICLQGYLLILIRNLMKKLLLPSNHQSSVDEVGFDNQLNEIVVSDTTKIDLKSNLK